MQSVCSQRAEKTDEANIFGVSGGFVWFGDGNIIASFHGVRKCEK